VGDTGRGAGAAAGHEPARAGPAVCVGGGGAAPAGPARGRCRSGSASPLPAPPGPATGIGLAEAPQFQCPPPRVVPSKRLWKSPPCRNLAPYSPPPNPPLTLTKAKLYLKRKKRRFFTFCYSVKLIYTIKTRIIWLQAFMELSNCSW